MAWLIRGGTLPLQRPLVMGILNVTPDSFSDGGRHASTEAAVKRGLQMAVEGADLIDVGGESTRPGAAPVPAAAEARRVVPVIDALAGELRLPLSVDTRKADVAAAAIEAGAAVVNDVSAGRHDPMMLGVVASTGAGVVLMHMQGEPGTMQEAPRYDDVVAEVLASLSGRSAAAVAAGVAEDAVAIDPGIGFGKTHEQNLELLRALPRFVATGRPVVVGVSRKSVVGRLTGRPVEARVPGSLALATAALLLGAHIVRAHDVAETRDAVAVVHGLQGGQGP